MPIQSFKDKAAQAIFQQKHPGKGFQPDLIAVARRKLIMLHRAGALDDLRVPPANRLEKLSGDRAGQYSIRVNDQFRICFRWTVERPEDVEIIDYH